MSDFNVERSRATAPLFTRAPAPPDTTPKEYQHAGVEYANSLPTGNVLFGDAPGLGKTAEAILTANSRGAVRNLIVCPASLRLNWEREIWRWSTIENVSTYPVLKASDGISDRCNYLIISYDLLRNNALLDAILDLRWDMMVLDEAHYLKDPKGNKRTRVICAPDMLPSVVGSIVMASGTILPNQPIECYNAIRLLNWDAINRASLEDFREFYYAEGGGMVMGPVFDKAAQTTSYKLHWSDKVRNQPRNLGHLQNVLRGNIMVRRLKEQVLTELPAKQWHPFPLSITSAMRQAMRHPGWQKAEKLYELDPHAFDHGVPIDGAIASARRELGEAKVSAVADYIDDLLLSGVEKLIVCAWHHSVLEVLSKRLEKYGFVYMDGGSSSLQKQNAVDKFQSNPRVRIMLGQMLPMGEGWTMTAAQDVVFAEADWVPGKMDQMLDRVHRMGQTGNYILGHVPVVPGTLDERILSSAIEKEKHIHAALDMLHAKT